MKTPSLFGDIFWALKSLAPFAAGVAIIAAGVCALLGASGIVVWYEVFVVLGCLSIIVVGIVTLTVAKVRLECPETEQKLGTE